MSPSHANGGPPSLSGATPTPKLSPIKSTPRRWRPQEPSRGHWRPPSPSLRKSSGRRPPWALLVFETQAGPGRKHTILKCARCFGAHPNIYETFEVRADRGCWKGTGMGCHEEPDCAWYLKANQPSMEDLAAFSPKFYLVVTGALHFPPGRQWNKQRNCYYHTTLSFVGTLCYRPRCGEC